LFLIKEKIDKISYIQKNSYDDYDELYYLVMALEDRRFLKHGGVDFRSILRECIKFFLRKKFGGASTIDMQMVRTITGFKERTLYRKFYELILAFIVNFKFLNIMKTHHLIMLTTAVATALFYRESFGLNVGLLAVFLSVITLVKTHKKRKDREFFIIFVLSILSAFAFMWYGDFVSFLAVSFSLLLLRFKSKYRRLKSILAVPIMTTNNIAFPYRFFDFNTWIIRDENSKFNFSQITPLFLSFHQKLLYTI